MNGAASPIDGPAAIPQLQDDAGQLAERSPEQRERMRRAFLAMVAEQEREGARSRRRAKSRRRWGAPAFLAFACVGGGLVLRLWLHRPHASPLAARVVTSALDIPLAATVPRPSTERVVAPPPTPTPPPR